MKAIDKSTAPHYQWGGACDSWVLADAEGLSVKQESLPGKAKEKLHHHFVAQQFFFTLKGTATFYVNEEHVVVAQQQGLLIPAKTKHFIANESPERLDILIISHTAHDQ